MKNRNKIREYKLDGKEHSEIFIDNPYEVFENILNHKEEILNYVMDSNEKSLRIRLTEKNYSVIDGIEIHENGIVFLIANTIPCDANKYDDFSLAKLYIFDEGHYGNDILDEEQIHYVFYRLDPRLYKEDCKINQEVIEKLDKKIGNPLKLKSTTTKGVLNTLKRREEEKEIARNQKAALIKLFKLLQPIEKETKHTEKKEEANNKEVITNVKNAKSSKTPKRVYPTIDTNLKGKRK